MTVAEPRSWAHCMDLASGLGRGRPAWPRWALMRLAALKSDGLSQSELARVIGASQQGVSNALRSIQREITTGRAQDSLEHWRWHYPGVGGSMYGWYSADPVVSQAHDAQAVADKRGVESAITGDVAADIYAPWRLPRCAHLYVAGYLDASEIPGMVPTSVEHATLITHVPADPTVLTTSMLSPRGRGRLADAVITLHDVEISGGVDVDEALERLSDYIRHSAEGALAA